MKEKSEMRSVHMTSPLTSAQLAEMIGMTEQHMLRGGFDLDLFDAARLLIEEKVDLDNRDDVVASLGGLASGGRHPHGSLDAAVILARSCTLTSSP
jgi:hypothetical protein